MGRSRSDTPRGTLTAVPDVPSTGSPPSVQAPPSRLGQDAEPHALLDAGCNEVRLVGRLGVGLRELVLPSGDPVVSFHLVVSRTQRGGRAHERRPREPTVDTLACAAWTSRCRRTVLAAAPGDVLEIEGALRRRFRRAAGGSPMSFYEVEVSRVRRRPAGR